MAFGIDRKRGATIIVLAGPIMIAMLTQTFINIVDTIFIGKLEPTYSIPGQAALGFSLPILWAVGGFLAAVGVGTQAMTARRHGANRLDEAGVVLFNSLIIAVVSSAVFTVIGWHLVPALFGVLTSNEAVADLGIPYAQIRVLGVLSMVATTSFKGFFDGIGRTRAHMYACLVMNAFNVVLNYVFIFGFGPIPAYYVTGAAIASLLSTYIGLAIMVGWSLRQKYLTVFRHYRPSNFSPRVSWELIKLSAPTGAAQIFVMSGVLLFMKIIDMIDAATIYDALDSTLYYGEELVVEAQGLYQSMLASPDLPGRILLDDWSYAVMHSRPPIYMTGAKLIIDMLSICFVTCIAFGQATATLVSQAMGKEDYRLAEAYGWDSVKLGIGVFGALSLVMLAFPEFFLSILSDDVMVIEAAIPGLRLMATNLVFIAMSLILIQALFGAGDTKFVMWVELVLHGIALAPLAYLFSVVFDWGYMGVWIAATVYIAALAVVMAWRFWDGRWKLIKV
jgi:multidrug resistance protein, MATE family